MLFRKSVQPSSMSIWMSSFLFRLLTNFGFQWLCAVSFEVRLKDLFEPVSWIPECVHPFFEGRQRRRILSGKTRVRSVAGQNRAEVRRGLTSVPVCLLVALTVFVTITSFLEGGSP